VIRLRGQRPSSAGMRIHPLRAAGSSREPATFLVATGNAGLAEELRQALQTLVGPCALEIVPAEGPMALARLRALRPRLAFAPMQMQMMDGLTLLRALPPARARQVVLLVPDTLEGYRVGWEGLSLGCRDFLVTRGNPPQRFKGSVGGRIRRLAHLLSTNDDQAGVEHVPLVQTTLTATPGPLTRDREPRGGSPWVVLAETRQLISVSAWLRTLSSDSPVVVRVPEGPRLLRVAREEFGRLFTWPVRGLVSGDRLVPGQIHLFSDIDSIRIDAVGGRPTVHLETVADPPGTWGAHHDLLARLRASTQPLRIVLPEDDGPEQEIYLMGGEPAGLEWPLHGIYHLAAGDDESADFFDQVDEESHAPQLRASLRKRAA
jgi:CheY-like chemotaxis protein